MADQPAAGDDDQAVAYLRGSRRAAEAALSDYVQALSEIPGRVRPRVKHYVSILAGVVLLVSLTAHGIHDWWSGVLFLAGLHAVAHPHHELRQLESARAAAWARALIARANPALLLVPHRIMRDVEGVTDLVPPDVADRDLKPDNLN